MSSDFLFLGGAMALLNLICKNANDGGFAMIKYEYRLVTFLIC